MSGVTFAPPDTDANGIQGSLLIPEAGYATNPTIALGVGSPYFGFLKVLFDGPNTAFGTDLFQNYGAGRQSRSSVPAQFQIDLYNGATLLDSITQPVQRNGGSFVGLTSTSPFDRILIRQNDGWAVMDNISFGAAVPEPATGVLLAAGLLGLAGWRRGRA